MPPKEGKKCTVDFLEQLLEKNPRVDENLVREFRAYQDLMRQAGVDSKPEFRVAPPLGGDLFGLRLSNG